METNVNSEDVIRRIDEDETRNLLTSKQKLFATADAVELMKTCKAIIQAGSISVERIKTALQSTSLGLSILRRYSMAQIQTKIKYERRRYEKKC